MSRLIIISNRLPFSIDHNGDQITVRQSSGGLVSAIKSFFENDSKQSGLNDKLWMGVADFPQSDWDAVADEVEKLDFNVVPLFMDATVYKDYYNGFSNSVIWPLFHYFPSLVDYKTEYFEAYVEANREFAKKFYPIYVLMIQSGYTTIT
jgi:Trehalose-6-phosphate synthase